ncbi:MAG TPA: peptidoglycan-binding domain-containing protein [Allosphingosinicella sp.]|nr:peptidoglycan-binding domain-containing protein [Allosphingosinicella sp.]
MTDPTPKKPPPARLNAPRFANDPVLTKCLAGTHGMIAGERGPAVKLVQQALIDLGHDLGPLADDGVFGTPTGKAVTGFKTKRRIFPNDPVVGSKTMAALDAEMVDKPPEPLSDRDEWLSWGRRAKLPRLSPYNFTRFDEFSRRSARVPFRLDPISSWMPSAFATLFLDHLSALLEPRGSPDGIGRPSATWGLSPVDLFHCHVAFGAPAGDAPIPLQDQALTLSRRLDGLRDLAGRAPSASPWNDAWSAAHAKLLNSVGVQSVFPMAATLINDIAAAATPGQPALLLWHTFERKGWRPHVEPGVEMPDGDQRRHWLSAFAPAPRRPARAPFVTAAGERAVVHLFFSICFVVDKSGLVTALPGAFVEVASVTGIGYDNIP